MNRTLFAISAVLVLAACEPSEEEKGNLKKALPEGCVAHDIGSYGSIDNLLIIECEGRRVTTTYSHMFRQNGKVSETDRAAVFVISPS